MNKGVGMRVLICLMQMWLGFLSQDHRQEDKKQAFVNWMKMLETQGSLYQVFDWKDETVHILDNLFVLLEVA